VAFTETFKESSNIFDKYSMDILLLKLVITPVLILIASLASRRWGEVIGGWIVGLPLTSAPVAVFLAIEQGPEFASQAASGSIIGTAAQACFCVGYARAGIRTSWPAAFLLGACGFAGGASLLQTLTFPLFGLLLVAVSILILSVRLIPLSMVQRRPVAVPAWDIPARMIVATAIVVTITSVAPLLGPRLSGIIATFPVFAAVLAIFAHRAQGERAAHQVLWGLLIGLFGFAGFFFVIGATISSWGVTPAFVTATISAVAIQGVSLWIMRRKRNDTQRIREEPAP
jgi:hypothetical protein